MARLTALDPSPPPPPPDTHTQALRGNRSLVGPVLRTCPAGSLSTAIPRGWGASAPLLNGLARPARFRTDGHPA